MITLDDSSREPAYAQIYRTLRSDLERGAYRPGEKLPSLRQLATELSVSRSTVARAYEQLYAEGYLVAKDRSGYRVDPRIGELASLVGDARAQALRKPTQEPQDPSGLTYDFAYGTLSDGLFPVKELRKATEIALSSTSGANAYGNPFGSPELRGLVAQSLARRRGVRCTAEQVIVLPSTRDGLEHLSKLFDPASDVVGIEQPGWPGAVQVFKSGGFPLAPIRTDATADAFYADLDAAHPKLVYTTPSYQFPTGKVMAYPDRVRLIDWAERNDAFIVEDDYDGEYRYGQLPIPSLQSLDRTDRVVYSGTLSKVFSPGLRLSYLVLPMRLLGAFADKLACYWCSVSWLVQGVVSVLFSSGAYDRQIRRQVAYFRKSRALLMGAIRAKLADRVEVAGDTAGLHIWARTADGMSSEVLADLARDKGVGIYPAKRYWMDPAAADESAFIMGYSSIGQDMIEPGVALLAEAWRDL